MKTQISVVVLVSVLLIGVIAVSSPIKVTVRNDWTLWEIAQDFNMSVSQLMELNNLKDSEIYPGQELKVIPYENSTATVSWYGPGFHGKGMANGKTFNMHDPNVVAHKWLPFGTKVKLTRTDTNKSVIVTVQDRGPYPPGRNFDLSKGGARELEMIDEGVVECHVDIL